ncbi:MAG: hypothetical protein GY874_11350 [Desulfobacteraceae bacterium]|nr:hypothetical protein [Desulfobacteraceae bacterium]
METKAILKQRRFFSGKRDFYLTNKKEVAVNYSTLFRKEKYTVSLFELDHKPAIVHYKAYHWFSFAAIFSYFWLSYLASYIPVFEPYDTHGRLFFIIPALICLVLYKVKSYDFVSINYYQTKESALLLWKSNPSETEYELFFELLIEGIKNTQISPEMSEENKIDIYLKHLEFLVSEAVISETEAQEIMERIVNNIQNKQSVSNTLH